MATLEERDPVTDPSEGIFHIVKSGDGTTYYSYYITYEDLLSTIKSDHPIVIGVYQSSSYFPTSGVNEGALAIAADETNRIYVYTDDEWEATSNSTTETIDTDTAEVYDSSEAYGSGNVFVSYVNEDSEETLFQTAALYRSRTETDAGISPEESLYDKDTNTDGKWEYQGTQVTVQSGGLAHVFYLSESEILNITDYSDGDNAVNLDDGTIYEYDSTATTGLQPNDNSETTGRWSSVGTLKHTIVDTDGNELATQTKLKFTGGLTAENDDDNGQTNVKIASFTAGFSFSGIDSFSQVLGKAIIINSVTTATDITELRVGLNDATATDITDQLPLTITATDKVTFEATYDYEADSYFTLIGEYN